jgi:hypothetical protein
MHELQAVMDELKTLAPAQLESAAGYIHRLKTVQEMDKTRALDRVFGSLTDDEANEMVAAITAHCKRIDVNAW